MIICNLCARNLGLIEPGKRYIFHVVQLNAQGEHSSEKHSVDVCPKCAADFWADFSALMHRFELGRTDTTKVVNEAELSARSMDVIWGDTSSKKKGKSK